MQTSKNIKRMKKKVKNVIHDKEVKSTEVNTADPEHVVNTTTEDSTEPTVVLTEVNTTVESTEVNTTVELTNENTTESTTVDTTIDTATSVDTAIKSQEVSLVDESQEILELIKMSQGILSQLSKGIRGCTSSIKRMEKDITKHNKRKDKLKNNKGKNGNKALKQLKPIYTETMTNFFKDNQSLHDRNDIKICSKGS